MHSDYFKINTLNSDHFSDRVFIVFKHFVFNAGTDHNHFTPIFDIQVVYQPAFNQVYRVNQEVVGVVALNAVAGSTIATNHIVVGSVSSKNLEPRSNILKIRKVVTECLGIIVVEIISSPTGEPFVRLCGGLRPHKHGIGRQVSHSLTYTIM